MKERNHDTQPKCAGGAANMTDNTATRKAMDKRAKRRELDRLNAILKTKRGKILSVIDRLEAKARELLK